MIYYKILLEKGKHNKKFEYTIKLGHNKIIRKLYKNILF